jgi:hypothetical protein
LALTNNIPLAFALFFDNCRPSISQLIYLIPQLKLSFNLIPK